MTATILPLPTGLTTDALENELLTLAGQLAAAECRFLVLLAEFDDRRGWAIDGVYSCAHWLSWRAGMNIRTANERLRVAHALQQLPKITEAFAAGRLSYSKVRAISRVVGSDSATLTRMAAEIAAGTSDLKYTTVADPETAEKILLTLALGGTAGHLETVVRAVRRRHAPAGDTAARRSLTWTWDDDGSLIVRARLTPDAGAAFISAIEARVPKRQPVTARTEPGPRDPDEQARELEPGTALDRTEARRADALIEYLTREPGEGPVVERGTAQVVVHLDADSGTARIENGPEIPRTTAERLACDARVQVLLNDRTGNRMYLSRTRRLATPAQIAALTVRDGDRCQFPGCVHTRYLNAHHVWWWVWGGPTDIDNLVLLCSHHHKVIHDHGYHVKRRAGKWEFARPDGSAIPATAPALSGNLEDLAERHARIDHWTLTPDWYGDRLDPDPILDALLPKRVRPVAA
ncbi:HNH endonuclease [Pseudonocardia zijingensis]|uniref:HNH endonuclease signature motif containing protein n=1 Tax=Pseudonocardia zijingensis TaxID=153376 RepID=A0ABN1NDC7_9PSEU